MMTRMLHIDVYVHGFTTKLQFAGLVQLFNWFSNLQNNCCMWIKQAISKKGKEQNLHVIGIVTL